MKMLYLFLLQFVLFLTKPVSAGLIDWHYVCTNNNMCLRTQTSNATTSTLSFAECSILCSEVASIWPKPTGEVHVSNLTPLNLAKISLNASSLKSKTEVVYHLVHSAFEYFLQDVHEQIPDHLTLFSFKSATALDVEIKIHDESINELKITTNESYVLKIVNNSLNKLDAIIEASTYFGARHALETLSQLIIFDDLRDRVLIPTNALITDAPAYPWRGLMLDTARNYINVQTIKRTLKAMGASKLNTFHWHLTDSSSFPYVSKSHPELSQKGAYSPSKVYTHSQVQEILDYARLKGVRVIPEFDAPGHVGEGWQDSGLVTCLNWQPWDSYCVEPPCGQFDPTKDKLYDVLEDIYGDILDQFKPEIFHMGGDEVNTNCWDSTEDIVDWMEQKKSWGRTNSDFMKLWNYFQIEARKRLIKKSNDKNLRVVLWDSDLTSQENVTEVLPIDQYIIQIWSEKTDEQITDLLNKNYTLILSNNDALYLDCGFGSWVADGDSWCAPYKSWKKAYENKPSSIVGTKTNQVLGSEAALWSEQVDSSSVDAKLWPRAAALAEVMWSEPETSWKLAEPRMLIHRERLVSRGINADALQPEWCRLNPNNCLMP